MLPICRLKILKVVGLVQVELFEVFGEDDDRISNEEVGEVSSQQCIHSAVHELLLQVFVYDKVRIHVLFP